MKDKGTKDTVSKVLNIIKSNLSNLMLAGLFIIFGVVLYIIFRSNPENFKDFAAIAWLALVLVTAIYACATVMILIENRRTIREMRQSRLDAVKPALSLQPGIFLEDGSFLALYLHNSGGVAKELKIDIKIDSHPLEKGFFVMALNKGYIAYLNSIDVKKLHETGGLVEVTVAFKDTYGQNLQETFPFDFANLKKDGRDVIGQESEQHVIGSTRIY